METRNYKKIGLKISCNSCFYEYRIGSHKKPKKCRLCDSTDIKVEELIAKIKKNDANINNQI